MCLNFSSSATLDSKTRGPEKSHYSEDDHGEKQHNAEYDHEVFLGKDEAKTFDELTPEESKERLKSIVKKIDKDQDGRVDEEELIEWIRYVQNRYVWSDVERQWKDFLGPKEDQDHLSWSDFKKRMYGDDFDEDNAPSAEEAGYNYKEMVRKDKRRWERADVDGNGVLSKEEFRSYLHPEDVPHMANITAIETLEEIDKNKDGKITLEEYLTDIWPNPDKSEEEPQWVKNEREQFHKYRDRNNDGYMDVDEVQEWVLPSDYDQSISEAKHLIHESDEDKDGFLTEQEILDKYDIFVGSQATDFGEVLNRHDEF